MRRTDVEEARRRIDGRVRRTPLLPVEPGDLGMPFGGFLKLEMTQHSGSFKARGAFNRLLAAGERGELSPDRGIVVASGGNAGLAYAFAATQLRVPARVFVPRVTSAAKLARIRDSGAEVVVRGGEYADAHEAATRTADETGALYCHAYDQLEMCAGAGTLGLELLEQVTSAAATVDTVLVAVGGGGLLAGVACAISIDAQIVAVEPRLAPTFHDALTAGEPVDVSVSGVAADSLGARRIGAIAWEVAGRVPIRSVLVDDDAMLSTRWMLWDRYRLVVEVGAAAALAALLSGAYLPDPNERIAVILCGGNTDLSTLV